MKLPVDDITARGLDVNSVMRCVKIFDFLLYGDLPDDLVKKVQIWLLENIHRPEVEFAMEMVFLDLMDGKKRRRKIID